MMGRRQPAVVNVPSCLPALSLGVQIYVQVLGPDRPELDDVNVPFWYRRTGPAESELTKP